MSRMSSSCQHKTQKDEEYIKVYCGSVRARNKVDINNKLLSGRGLSAAILAKLQNSQGDQTSVYKSGDRVKPRL